MTMSSEKSLTPQIRFKGFTEAWEQRKLGELMEVTSVRRVHQDDWTTQGVRFLRARDLVAYANNTEIELPLYISKKLYEKYTALSGKVEIGDLLVTGVGTIGVPWLVETPSPVYFKDGNIIWFKNKNTIYGKYFYYAFTSASIQNFIKESAGTGTVGTYTIDTGKKTPIYIPPTFEQHKIASAMKRFDSLITLHQRKLDALKKIKSALLEKMFPKDGSNIPEIRFTGFTEAWEQRKLGDIATKQTLKNTNSTIREPFTNSAEQGVVSQYDYFEHGITNVANINNYFVICPNDFVYNPRISVTAPCGPINRNRLNKPGIMSPLYTIFRTNQCIDITYLEYYFKTKKWHPFMFLEGNTGARSDRFSISDSTFFKMPIQTPSKAEQRLISKQLEALNNLITLHQRKLDALKKIKSALLEKMFV